MSNNQPSVVIKTRDYVKTLVPLIEQFPKNQRYILGSRLQNSALDTMDLLLDAYYSANTSVLAKLYQANLLIEKQRHLLRLCFELKYFNIKKFEMLIRKLQEIGRMVGGWIKKAKS